MMRSTYLLLLLLTLTALTACETNEQEASVADEPLVEGEIQLNVPAGFEIEELFSPSDHDLGTWVSLAEGPDGRFYASDQFGNLYQFRMPAVGQTLDSTQVDSIDLDIGHAHGLLWAFNSLYVMVNRNWKDTTTNHASGLYRMRDTDQDGELDDIQMLMKLEGSGEHGPHSMVLSPDGQHLYFIAGNYTKIPTQISANSRLPNNWQDDNLFPPYLDARGHATELKPPGGWIARTNETGSEWELIASGFRNPFDIAFNADGELFTFDADMEWDIGMPWYRPIRICHVTSGADYGWRNGSGKWSSYYPDNLPAVVDLGQGSPTALLAGQHLQFPEKYRNGLFAADWSFGTMYYVDLDETGSTYTGASSEFLSGIPLPLTDVIAGSDGHMYFATGGRKLESQLFRVRYTGEATGTAVTTSAANDAEMRQIRQSLEALHQPSGPEAVTTAWSYLDHPDRFIRYAARLALEHQPARQWQTNLRQEQNPEKLIEASIAVAKVGTSAQMQQALDQLLSQTEWGALSATRKIDVLRAYQLLLSRLKTVTPYRRQALLAYLKPIFPADDLAINREVSQLLVYLEDEEAVPVLVDLLEKHTEEKTRTHAEMISEDVSMRSKKYGPTILEVLENMPPTEAIFYNVLLSQAEKGWTKELRETYFRWYYKVLSAKGGMSFKASLENMRQAAIARVPASEQAYFEEISGVYSPAEYIANLPQPEGPGEDYNFVDMLHIIRDMREDPQVSVAKGKEMYEAALCGTCHRMRGEGGSTGPDLTQVYTRFKEGDLIVAIFSPNEEISDQYAFNLYEMKDGSSIAGKPQSETADSIALVTNPYVTTYTVNIAKADIAQTSLSPISPMPPNLLNRLNREEVMELMAYLLSGGNENHVFYGGTEGALDKEED